jgi:hypothetical protein
MRTEQEFRAYFGRTVLPRLSVLKAQFDREWRRNRLRWKVLGIGAPVIAFALNPIVLISIKSGILPDRPWIIAPLPILVAGGLIVCPIVAVVLSYRFKARWAPVAKREVMVPAVRHLAPEFEYDPGGTLPAKSVIFSGLFQDGSARIEVAGDDRFKGRIGKTQVEFGELVVSYTATGRKRRSGSEHGLMLIADFNKRLEHRTLILPDYAESASTGAKVAGAGILLGLAVAAGPAGALAALKYLHDSARGGQDAKGGMQLVRLENSEFEKHFAVYSSDDVEARYILTPAFMERMTGFFAQFGKGARFSFAGHSLHMFIPTTELFELDLKGDVTRFEVFSEHLGPLALVADIVELLNLNTRLWTK